MAEEWHCESMQSVEDVYAIITSYEECVGYAVGIERASLIAASPDLLVACEAAAEWAASYPLSGAFGVMDKWAADEVYKKCQVAIAKANATTTD